MTTDNHPKDVWDAYVRYLEEGCRDKWLDLWSEDCDFIVQYGRKGVPEKYHGKGDVDQFIWGTADKVSKSRFADVVVSEVMASSETLFFTAFSLSIELKNGYLYRNEIASRVTLAEGKIKQVWELADPIRRNAFIRVLSADAS